MMRSFLVAALFVHAVAQTPETVDVPQNVTSSETSSREKKLQQQAAFGNKMRNKFMKEYAGQYDFPVHNDTFDANGSMTQETQDWYKSYFQNKFGGMGSNDDFSNKSSDWYRKFMDEYVTAGSSGGHGDYQKYVDEFLDNNSFSGDYSQYMPPEGKGLGGADLVDYYLNKFLPGGKAEAGMEGTNTTNATAPEDLGMLAELDASMPETPQNATSADASAHAKELQQQAAFGNKMRSKYMKAYAGSYAFPEHNDTFDANGSMTQETQDWYKNYFKNKYGSIGSDSAGSSGSSFDYQKYIGEFTGNSSMAGNYMGKYASQLMPPEGNSSGGSDLKGTALASSLEAGTSPLLLLLCALAGASIPMALAAAWHRRRLESDEESTRFLLMA